MKDKLKSEQVWVGRNNMMLSPFSHILIKIVYDMKMVHFILKKHLNW